MVYYDKGGKGILTGLFVRDVSAWERPCHHSAHAVAAAERFEVRYSTHSRYVCRAGVRSPRFSTDDRYHAVCPTEEAPVRKALARLAHLRQRICLALSMVCATKLDAR